MNIEVIELKDKHASEYLSIRVESEIELPQFVGPSAERELLAGENGIQEILSKYPAEGTTVFGAFVSERLVGVVAVTQRLSPKFIHRAFIWGMYVRKEARQLNIGAALLEHTFSWARSSSEVKVLWLQVTSTNTPAIIFYKKYGFKKYGTEPKSLFTQEIYHDVHYMQISIDLPDEVV